MKGCPENNEDEGKVGTGQEEEGGMCRARKMHVPLSSWDAP